MKQQLRPEKVLLDPKSVEDMCALLSAQTKECVMDTLGISWDTWIKIKRGGTVRPTTALRVLQRLTAENAARDLPRGPAARI